MFYERVLQDNIIKANFTPFPKITDRTSWNEINISRKKDLLSIAEGYMPYMYPAIPSTLYMDYCRTGNRVRFEDVYKERRRKLNTFVLAESVQNDGRFMDVIIDGVFHVCEESAWQLPAHNKYTRDSGENILPDPSLPVLDLYACETGAQLAMIYYLMKDKLDQISESICKRIETELMNRIIRPYLHGYFWWMGNDDDKHLNNWTTWCTQNVLFTVFLLSSESNKNIMQKQLTITDSWPLIQEQVLKKATRSIDKFLNGYGEDGCCDEGALYYHHAGLCLFNIMELMNFVTNQAFDFYHEPKIKNIAEYICNVHVNDTYYINFADCSPIAGRAGAREFIFGKRVNSQPLMMYAALDYKTSSDKLLSDEVNLYYRVQSLFTNDEMETYDTTYPVTPKDIYYPSTGLFLTRDSKYFLGVKAGHNNDSHNHNDIGSFTIYKNGLPFIIDVGVETYSKKTFSTDRYEIWTMQSAYHNLPTINTIMQKDGIEYYAKDVEVNIHDNSASIAMDIAGAYPKEADIEHYIRKVTLNKEDNIIIEDKFSFIAAKEDGNCVLSLMLYERPRIVDNIIYVGTLGQIKINSNTPIGSPIEFEEIPITDARLQIAWKHQIYRVKISIVSNYIKLTIT